MTPTPGTWVVIGMPGVDFLGITSEQGAGLSDHAIAKIHGSDGRGRANARLIAAAPDLLAAAKRALAWYEPRLAPGEEGPICKQLTAAINKAEGR